MYDPLWEEHPKVKRIKAQLKADAQAEVEAKVAEAEARARAEAEAKARAEVERVLAEIEKAREEVKAEEAAKKRETVLQIVQARFPELASLAEQSIKKIDSPDVLNFLLIQVASAANETVARNILHPSAA